MKIEAVKTESLIEGTLCIHDDLDPAHDSGICDLYRVRW